MTEITVKDLQDIAVECVSGFFNDNAPLSTGLCKAASERDLNSDQLKRAVEATNTLAYLKSVQINPDRTGEFPLANYEEIVKMASLPEDFQPVEETAQLAPTRLLQDGLDKQAELLIETPNPQEISFDAFFMKRAAAVRNELNYALGDSVLLKEELLKTASELKADPYCLEALSVAENNEAQFTKLARLVWGEPKARSEVAEFVPIPKQSLEKAAALKQILNDATELVEKIQGLQELQKSASEIRTGMEKEALASFFARAAAALKGPSAAARKWDRSLAPGPVTRISGAIGKGVGTAAAAPVKAVGKTVGSVMSSGGVVLKNKISRNIGGKVGVPVKPATADVLSAKKKWATGAAVAGAGLDATMYSPAKNKVTGESSDIWDQIYG